MLADSLVAGSRGVYVEQVVGELTEPLDLDRFRQAWEHAVQAFDALRLRFRIPQTGPASSFVGTGAALPFAVHDLRARTDGSAPAIEAFLAADRALGVDVRADLLMRVAVLRLTDKTWGFVWTVHHAIIDGPSYARVLRFVFACYDDPAGRVPAPPGPPFSAFVRWLSACDFSDGVRAFDAMLEGFEGATPPPLHPEAMARAQGRTSEVRVRLPVADSAVIVDGAHDGSGTLLTALHLAWGLLLGRYAGVDDVVFATTWSGRGGALSGVADVVGPCVNSLPVRVTCAAGATVRDALTTLHDQQRALRPHRSTPFNQLASARAGGRMPLGLTTSLVYDATKFEVVSASAQPGRWSRRHFWSRSQTHYALGVAVHIDRGALVLDLEYDLGLYDKGVAQRLLGEYLRLLTAVVTMPDALLERLPMLDPVLEQSLTVEEAAREQPATAPTPVVRFFEAARARPDAVAVIDTDGSLHTYAALAQRVLDVAAVIPIELHGDAPWIIGIHAPRSIDAVVAMLAVHAAGAAFLPLDPAFPATRLDSMARDAGLAAILVTAATAGRLPGVAGSEIRIDRAAASSGAQPAVPVAEALAYVIYTSGSTGQPNGVCIPHGALANHTAAAIATYALTPDDRVLQFSALGVDVAIEEIFPTLAVGATLVLRDEAMASSGRDCLETLARLGVTVANLPTAFWRLLSLTPGAAWPATLRLLIVGGERAAAEDLRAFRGAGTAHIRWINGYGPTETTITSTSYDDADGTHHGGTVPIGRPWPGVSHFVLDPARRVVPPGAVGELFIGGAGLASGYLRRPALTATRFGPHPFRSGARLYATGDLVRANDRRQYLFVGRRDHQVKIRGFRVEPGEIEQRLREQPGVADAVVIAVTRGTDVPTLHGFVVAGAAAPTETALRDGLERTLPAHMIPQLRVIDALPMSAGGKVDRAALAAIDMAVPREAAAGPAADPIEARLQRIWEELLGTRWIDPQARFSDLGGHSLLLVQMLVLVEQRFNRAFDVRAFLPTPTIRHLASLIREASLSDWSAPLIEVARGHARLRPLFLAPSISGWGLAYAHLVDALHPDIPVLALQSAGLRTGTSPNLTLEDMATRHADDMQRAQPEGPYALAGYSAGAVVALAISQVLVQRGERADFIGLIDGIPPTTIPMPGPLTHPRRFARFSRAALVRGRQLLRTRGWAGAWSRLRRGVAQRRRREGAEAEPPLAVHDLFAGVDITLNDRQVAFMQAHLDAVSRYTPRREALDVVLFRTVLDPLEGPHEPDLGWHRATSGHVTVVPVPGDHEDLLTVRGAPALARRLDEWLLHRTR